MALLLALACGPDGFSDVRAFPTGLAETDLPDGDVDADADADADADTDSDTDGDSDTDSDPGIEACYLGTGRAYDACYAVVDYDATTFGAAYDYPDPLDGSPQYAAPARYLDLTAVDLADKIAPNFALDELLSADKGRWGVLQSGFVDQLQRLRDRIGEPLYITSGYRSPDYNAGVGGVEYSRHQYGDAADMYANSYSVEALGDECAAIGASYVGLYEDGHTHCDWRDAALDGAFYDGDRRRPSAIPEESARIVATSGRLTAPATGFDEGEPLRRWTAWDADGAEIGAAYGREFVPPDGAVAVDVVVGGRVALTWRR